MNFPRGDFLYEMEKFHRSLRKALRIGEDMLGMMQDQIPSWFQGGPKAEVYDEGKRVRVVLEAPGMHKNVRMKWSHRIIDGHMVLRGQYNVEQTLATQSGKYYSERNHQHFVKWIPLPASVRRKPAAIRYRNGLVELLFDKSDRADSRWYDWE